MNRVLIVVHQLNIGGAQKSLITLLNAIDYSKHGVTLYIRRNRLDLANEINPNVHTVYNCFDKHKLRTIKQLLYSITSKATEHLHLNDFHQKVERQYAKYNEKRQLRYELSHYPELSTTYDVVISYLQGTTAQFVAENIKARKRYVFWHDSTDSLHELHERLFPMYDAVIGVSGSIQVVLQQLYPRHKDKIRYITNYVDPKLICSLKDEYTVSKCTKGLTLCSCGRFTMVKGFDIALEAADKLKEDGVAFLWYFVGDGPERENLERYIVEYNLQDQIVITGLQKNPYPYMDACDIYVQPSREEANPLVLLEAKILCKPIVTTATVGGKSNVKDGVDGFITAINGDDVAKGIEYFYKNKAILTEMIATYINFDDSSEAMRYRTETNYLLSGKI